MGCGGTGSHIASGLPAILQGLPGATQAKVILIDPDHVEGTNIGRQLFQQSELGSNKAEALAGRMARAYGILPGVHARAVAAADLSPAAAGELHIVIGAVDNHEARKLIAHAVAAANGQLWWLDCGNELNSGQVGFGNTAKPGKFPTQLGLVERLPAPSRIWPDMLTRKAAQATAASCAEATAAGEQGLMVNRMVAAHALSMLTAALMDSLKYFSISFNSAWGTCTSQVIDAKTLEAFAK